MSLGTLAAGGCADGLLLVVQGDALRDSSCSDYLSIPVNVRSTDISGDLMVSLVDIALFAAGFPPQPYATCSDLNQDGGVDLQDLTIFAAHFIGHSCY